jgi:lysophospholipase L1-like esterase
VDALTPLRRRFITAALLSLLAIGCGGGSSPTAPTPTPAPAASALSLACPSTIAVTTAGSGVTVTYDTPSATGGEAPVVVACTPASGQPFQLGTTDVRCTATDNRGQSASCGFAVHVSRLPTLSKTKFLAFGDSVTVGIISTVNPTGAPPYLLREAPDDAYPSVLRRLLSARYPAQAVTVVNGGKGGEKAVDGVGRASGLIDAERPDAVLVLDGYNDLGIGEAGIAPGIAAVNEIVKTARFRGARVFLATLTPPNRNATRGLSNSLITAFNDRLRAMARGENAVLVDLYEAMASQPDLYNSADGRHPNEAGYRKIAETFFTAIQAELEAR